MNRNRPVLIRSPAPSSGLDQEILPTVITAASLLIYKIILAYYPGANWFMHFLIECHFTVTGVLLMEKFWVTATVIPCMLYPAVFTHLAIILYCLAVGNWTLLGLVYPVCKFIGDFVNFCFSRKDYHCTIPIYLDSNPSYRPLAAEIDRYMTCSYYHVLFVAISSYLVISYMKTILQHNSPLRRN